MKMAIDSGNGRGGVVAAPAMRELGLEVIELFTQTDGHSPNYHPDPTAEENIRYLQQAVT
jgi:phosphomannomutase